MDKYMMLAMLKARIKKIKFNTKDENLVRIFSALGDSTRYRIIILLLKNKDICVGDIADSLNISASAVSQHMKILELSGLVSPERHGQNICYIIKKDSALVECIIKIINNK